MFLLRGLNSPNFIWYGRSAGAGVPHSSRVAPGAQPGQAVTRHSPRVGFSGSEIFVWSQSSKRSPDAAKKPSKAKHGRSVSTRNHENKRRPMNMAEVEATDAKGTRAV